MDNKKVENKKQMSNKKKFWVGMAALAAVGIITTTVAWFTSSHQFTNKFNVAQTSITVTQLLNREKALKMVPGRQENLDIRVKNTSTEEPMLARIRYVNVGENDTETSLAGADLAKKAGIEITAAKDKDYLFTPVDGNKFTYNSADGWYYYVGVIPKDTEVQHLDYVTLSTDFVGTGNNTYSTTTDENLDPNNPDKSTWNQLQGPTPDDATGFRATLNSGNLVSNIAAVVETTQATTADGETIDESAIGNLDAAVKAWTHPAKGQ